MDLCISCYNYIANTLLDIFSFNLDYFCENVPVTNDIMAILRAVGGSVKGFSQIGLQALA